MVVDLECFAPCISSHIGHRLDLEVSINPKPPAPDRDSTPPETDLISSLPAEPAPPVPHVAPCPSGVISGASLGRTRGPVEEELRAELVRLEAQNRRLAERVDQAEAAMVAVREAFAALGAAEFFQDATYLDLRPVLGRASAAVGIGKPEQTVSWPEALRTATQALADAEARRAALAERDADAMQPEPVEVAGSDPRWDRILSILDTLPEEHRDVVGDELFEAYSLGIERGVERGQAEPDVSLPREETGRVKLRVRSHHTAKPELDLRDGDSEPEPELAEAVRLTDDADWEAIAARCGGLLVNAEQGQSGEVETVMLVPTPDGQVEAREGDWVIWSGDEQHVATSGGPCAHCSGETEPEPERYEQARYEPARWGPNALWQHICGRVIPGSADWPDADRAVCGECPHDGGWRRLYVRTGGEVRADG